MNYKNCFEIDDSNQDEKWTLHKQIPNSDSATPKAYKNRGFLRLNVLFSIWPWNDLDPDLMGSNRPRILIQRPQKHIAIVVSSDEQNTFFVRLNNHTISTFYCFANLHMLTYDLSLFIIAVMVIRYVTYDWHRDIIYSLLIICQCKNWKLHT